MLSLNYLNNPPAYGLIQSDFLFVCLFCFALLFNNAEKQRLYISSWENM